MSAGIYNHLSTFLSRHDLNFYPPPYEQATTLQGSSRMNLTRPARNYTRQPAKYCPLVSGSWSGSSRKIQTRQRRSFASRFLTTFKLFGLPLAKISDAGLNTFEAMTHEQAHKTRSRFLFRSPQSRKPFAPPKNGRPTLLSSKVVPPSIFSLNPVIFTVSGYVGVGIEAGGHGSSTALPLFTLLPLVRDSLSSLGSRPLIVAAGGLATGDQIASILVLGADGVVLGTRFTLSPESLCSEAQRKALIAADSTLSVRTMAFDHVRGTLGWPKGIDGRALRNRQLLFHLSLAVCSIII